jgi:NAD(P)-dependent dehydrogenase (short-subunit alcohol dehydrogenase family)
MEPGAPAHVIARNTPWWTDEGGAADIIAAQTGADRATLMTTVVPQMTQRATGRLAEPQEVADAVALLCSPRSASTTGTQVVDLGFLKAS